MIEVESKVRINNPEKYRRLSQKYGRYKGKERKIDDYYTLEDTKSYPKKSFRIRKKGKDYIVNFKDPISYEKGVFAKKETEFLLSDYDGFVKLLNEFGFKKWLRKEKYTELYEIRKNFHIELNHIKKLGWFLEIEYLCTKNKIESAKKEVIEMLIKLGFKTKDAVKEGYTKMLWNHR